MIIYHGGFKYPTHQINFCTRKALECLTFKGSEEVKNACCQCDLL